MRRFRKAGVSIEIIGHAARDLSFTAQAKLATVISGRNDENSSTSGGSRSKPGCQRACAVRREVIDLLRRSIDEHDSSRFRVV